MTVCMIRPVPRSRREWLSLRWSRTARDPAPDIPCNGRGFRCPIWAQPPSAEGAVPATKLTVMFFPERRRSWSGRVRCSYRRSRTGSSLWRGANNAGSRLLALVSTTATRISRQIDRQTPIDAAPRRTRQRRHRPVSPGARCPGCRPAQAPARAQSGRGGAAPPSRMIRSRRLIRWARPRAPPEFRQDRLTRPIPGRRAQPSPRPPRGHGRRPRSPERCRPPPRFSIGARSKWGSAAPS